MFFGHFSPFILTGGANEGVMLGEPNNAESEVIYGVSNCKLTFRGETRDFEAAGGSGFSEIVELETTDGLKAEVSIQNFHDGTVHIRLTEFLATPPPLYSHLISNGTMTVQTRTYDGHSVALLRALRPGGKEYPTLNSINIEELNSLLEQDTELWLKSLGFALGKWIDVNPEAGKFKDALAVSIEADKKRLLVLPWALTRVIALMKKLGKPTLESN